MHAKHHLSCCQAGFRTAIPAGSPRLPRQYIKPFTAFAGIGRPLSDQRKPVTFIRGK
jgi:hypothetical protein